MNSARPATPFPLLPPTNPAAQWQSNQTKIPCDARHPIRHPRHNSDRDADASLFPPFTAFLSTLFRSTLILADLQSSSPLPSIDKSPSTERLRSIVPQPSRFRGNDTQAGQPPFSSAPTYPPPPPPLSPRTHSHTHARVQSSSPRFALLGRSCSHVKPNRSDTLYAREPPLSRLVAV